MHLFEDCAKRLHPETLNSKSYIIRRSQFIQKYIRLCQAHMIRTYSSKLDQAERHFKEIQSQWDELTQQEELRQLDMSRRTLRVLASRGALADYSLDGYVVDGNSSNSVIRAALRRRDLRVNNCLM